MTDVQELRRHIRLLEDQVQYGDNVAGELAALSEQVDRLEGRIESLDQSNAELRTLLAELINAFNRNIDRMAGAMDANTATLCARIDGNTVAKPAAPASSPFPDEMFKPDAEAKRPKAKLRVVPPDEPKPGDA